MEPERRGRGIQMMLIPETRRSAPHDYDNESMNANEGGLRAGTC